MLKKALKDITALWPNCPFPTDILNQSSTHHKVTATDSVHGSKPKNLESNGYDLQWPHRHMAKAHFNPADSGYQSLSVSPISESTQVSHPVVSSPIIADQTSLQGTV